MKQCSLYNVLPGSIVLQHHQHKTQLFVSACLIILWIVIFLLVLFSACVCGYISYFITMTTIIPCKLINWINHQPHAAAAAAAQVRKTNHRPRRKEGSQSYQLRHRVCVLSAYTLLTLCLRGFAGRIYNMII